MNAARPPDRPWALLQVLDGRRPSLYSAATLIRVVGEYATYALPKRLGRHSPGFAVLSVVDDSRCRLVCRPPDSFRRRQRGPSRPSGHSSCFHLAIRPGCSRGGGWIVTVAHRRGWSFVFCRTSRTFGTVVLESKPDTRAFEGSKSPSRGFSFFFGEPSPPADQIRRRRRGAATQSVAATDRRWWEARFGASLQPTRARANERPHGPYRTSLRRRINMSIRCRSIRARRPSEAGPTVDQRAAGGVTDRTQT
jgi:hypothetical protein